MNMIYDIVLNYEKVEDSYEFYEWKKEDHLRYIEKIPILKIRNQDMKKCLYSKFQISSQILKKIKNKTLSSEGIISYSLLLTDGLKVVSFSFDEEGVVKEKSSLLLDEETAVMEESEGFPKEKISYKILQKYQPSFFTRKEKQLQKVLLKKIEKLYQEKNYEEIDYLYQECFSKKKSFQDEYKQLMKNIEHELEDKYESLYEIIALAEK